MGGYKYAIQARSYFSPAVNKLEKTVENAIMCRLSVVALTFLCLILQSHAEGAAREEGSPQFIYMELLRQHTHDMGVIGTTMEGTDDGGSELNSQAPGTLLATSFKDTSKSNRYARSGLRQCGSLRQLCLCTCSLYCC